MKKLYELDASKEFEDESNATESGDISEGGVIAGDFETVSGMGIGESLEDDEEVENNLQEMLAAINSRTGQDAEDFARQEAERNAYLEEEEKRTEEAKARFNRERYEKEQAALAERNERERIEREEEERLAAEKAENSFFNKLQRKLNGKLFDKKSKNARGSDTDIEEKNKTSDTNDIREEYAPEPDEFGSFSSAEEDIDLSGFVTLDDKEEESAEKHISEQVDKSKEPVISQEEGVPEEERSRKGLFSVLSKGSFSKNEKKPKKQAYASAEPDWKFIATHDEATGLLNARAYKDDLSKQKKTLGVIFFDVNNLRAVNEEHGRAVGDKVIETIAEILKDTYGKEHLYRIGGGEFACIVPSPGRNFTDTCIKNSGKVHNACALATKEDSCKAIHSVSIGYAQGDGEASVQDVARVADCAMYQNKKAYKLAHSGDNAQINGANGVSGTGKAREQVPEREKDHDELLSKEQKELKEKVKDGHAKVSRSFTANVMREIQKRAGEIEAILIASPTFDHLFVISDIDDFLDMMDENQALIDYSYLYVVYQGGTQYYGADEYYDKVTDLFRNVADALLSGRFRSEKDIQSIPGINIFKNVYV